MEMKRYLDRPLTPTEMQSLHTTASVLARLRDKHGIDVSSSMVHWWVREGWLRIAATTKRADGEQKYFLPSDIDDLATRVNSKRDAASGAESGEEYADRVINDLERP
jgi:hypothetical protein